MRRGAAVAVAAALVVGATACRGADEPPDYSDLPRLAARLNQAVGTPPGIAEVHARGGSMGDAGYFVIDVLLEPDATADQLLELLGMTLPHAMSVAGGRSGAPLTIRTLDGDRLEPDWGPFADLVAEEPAIRTWVGAETALEVPVTGQAGEDGGAFQVDLGESTSRDVARTYRALRQVSPEDVSWDLTAADDGTALRLASRRGVPDAAGIGLWRSLLASCQQPTGGFACSGLGLDVIAPLQYSGSLVLRVPPSIEGEELTPATYGSTLLPLLTAQARLLKRPSVWSYGVSWSHEAGLVPVLPDRPPAGPADAGHSTPLFQLPVQPEKASPWAAAVRAALRG